MDHIKINFNVMVSNLTHHKLISSNNLIPTVYNLMTLLFYNTVLFSSKIVAIYSTGNKGTAVPLQAWSGPEGSRKLRFPDFMATAQDGGKVVSLTHRPPLPPGNTPGTHFC